MRTLSAAFRANASGDANQPLELYDMYLDNEVVHFVNYDKNISYFDIDGVAQTYTALPISRQEYERSLENPINSVVIGIANIDKSISAYLAANDFRGRRLVIRKVFADALSSADDNAVIFDGVMDTPAASEESVQVNAVDRIGTLFKEVPRRWYQLLCNWKFGDAFCSQGKTSGDMYGTARYSCSTGSSTKIIKSATLVQVNNYWIDGDIQITSGQSAIKKRKVVSSSQSENSVNLDFALPYAPVVGDTFTIRRTCDKTHFRCSGDFSNDLNWGGFDSVPAQMVVRIFIGFVIVGSLLMESLYGIV